MKSIKLAVAGALLAVGGASMANPISVDAGWYGFCFGPGAGQPATNGCQNLGVGTAGTIAARLAPQQLSAGRLHFAHADWAGYSIFEEAFTLGHGAGLAVPARA